MLQKRQPVKSSGPPARSYKRLLNEVIGLVETGRTTTGRVVNQTMTATYWLVGRQIVEHEQQGASRAGYGDTLIVRLSTELTKRYGRGFSRRNIAQMKAFYLWKPILQTPSAKFENAPSPNILQTLSAKFKSDPLPLLPLPWSHYNRLLSVGDRTARAYYESEATRGGWSVRQLDRQIASLAYQRTKGKLISLL